ncbi:MAG: RHS repeat-associated core domain-containing protein, partial [Vulcanimicrobiota bacterium]
MVSKKLYWWLGGSIVTERDALQTDYPITKRYFGQGVLQTASLGGGSATKLYYTTDHLGSVRELLDESGNVVAEYRYSIYGERTKISGDLDSDWGFAGLFHHEPSGLDLATYRLYDAKQRRFISRDPLGEAVDYNLYRYAGNNPVNMVDPEGLLETNPDGSVRIVRSLGPAKPKFGRNKFEAAGYNVELRANDGRLIKAFWLSDPDASKAGAATDCHGLTFTGGSFWIDNDQIIDLLQGDGYTRLRPGETPQPLDKVIYLDKDGKVFH